LASEFPVDEKASRKLCIFQGLSDRNKADFDLAMRLKKAESFGGIVQPGGIDFLRAVVIITLTAPSK